MGRNRFEIAGNASGAVKAIEDLNRAIEKGEKSLQKTAETSTKVDKALDRLARKHEGPQERYNRKIEELARLFQGEKISIEQATAAAERYGRQLDKAGDAGKAVHGPSALAGLKNVALQYIGIGVAVNGALSALRKLGDEKQRQAQAALQSRAGLGQLAQLAATAADPEAENARLIAEARALQMTGAAIDENEAGNITFGLNSAGLSRADRDFAVELKRSGVLSDVGGIATAFAAITTAMGQKEVGTFEDLVSKALQASSAAPALANEIPQAATRAAGSAAALGLSDEFLYAATAILAKKTGSAPEGGTQLASFLKQVEKAQIGDLQGKSGSGIVEYLAGLSEADQGFGGVLGDRAEAIAGFRTLRDNIGLLKELTSQIDQAQTQGLARKATALPAGDVGILGAQAKARAQATYDQSFTEDSALFNLVDAAFLERKRTVRANGGGIGAEIEMGVESSQLWWNKYLEFSNVPMQNFLRQVVSDGSLSDPQLFAQIAEYLRRIDAKQTQAISTRQE